jgi:hypothetical protein
MRGLALERVRKNAVNDVNGPILVHDLDGIDRAGRPRRKAAIKNAPAARIAKSATAYTLNLYIGTSRLLGRSPTFVILESYEPFVNY